MSYLHNSCLVIEDLIEAGYPLKPQTIENHFLFVLPHCYYELEVLLLLKFLPSLALNNGDVASSVIDSCLGTVNHLFYSRHHPNDGYFP